MTQLLERLAEMFPKQNYQSRLEQYIASRHPQNVADVEMFTRDYNQQTRSYLWENSLEQSGKDVLLGARWWTKPVVYVATTAATGTIDLSVAD